VTTDELVDEIFGRCRERIERGEVVDVEEVLRVHADLAEPLRERFSAARLLDRVGARARRGDPAAATRVGTTLGPYRIEAVLGAGGMGTVYLAGAEGASRVALKVFHPHLVSRGRFAARFEREAELGRRVDHPNVVRTLEAGESREADQTLRWLVMEHVEGRTLRALLSEMGRLPEELVRHVGREVAKGLAAIHAAGAVHRDLKPENVIVTKDHVVKVMDLGVAHVEDAATLSETGAFVGSLRYGAPEQVGRGGGVDGRADLHALGLLLHELAAGAHAFSGEEFGEVVRQILDVRPRRLGELAPQVSPFLEELVAQLLEKDRERRPASASAVAAILEEGEESSWWKRRAVNIRRETRRPLRRIRIPRETALYGRDSEIARLRGLYEKAKAGDGQVVLVEGEAGIGKSRLVDEFVLSLWAAGEDIDFLFGSYPPGGAATASGAFSTAYREHLGDDEDAIREALPQTPLLVPAFAALLRGDAPPEGAEKLTKDSLQTVFVHATRSFAAKRTTIVLIDDLHFAPEEGRALFASIALAAPGRRVLLVGGARPSLEDKWVGQIDRLDHATRVALPRLGAKDLIELLVDALKSRHLAEELGAKIATKSDGNPFFAFEILRGLREGQFLTRKSDGTWITTRAIQEIDVPTSIVDVIQARVSGLDKDERDLLEVASCVGFEFDAALVGDVLGVAPIPLLQRLGRIEKAHRLVRSVGHRFAFDHHQVQEVLYGGLSPPLREAYHAAIADAIEQRSGAASKEPKDLDGALCLDLTEQFLRGVAGGRALRYLDAALTHLESRSLNDEAVRLCDRALAVPDLLTGGDRGTLCWRLAARLDVLGRRERQRSAAEESLTLARKSGHRQLEVRATSALAAVMLALGRTAEAEEHYRRNLALALEIGDRESEIVARANWGSFLFVVSRLGEAREHNERLLAFVTEIGDRVGEIRVRGHLGNVLMSLGQLDQAQEHLARQLALARRIGDRRLEAVATVNLGIVDHARGRFPEARERHEQSLALVQAIGDRPSEVMVLGNLSNSLLELGSPAEAHERVERGLVLTREIGARRGEAFLGGTLGYVLLRLGLLHEALESFERSLSISREIGSHDFEAMGLCNLGDVYLSLGCVKEARERLDRCHELAREIGHRQTEAGSLAMLAEVASESGDAPLAERLLTSSIELRRAVGLRSDEAESLLARGVLYARMGREEQARADLADASATARALGLPNVALPATAHLARLPDGDATAALADLAACGERVGLRTRMQVGFVLWQATHDRALLVEAKRLLDFLVDHAPPEFRESMTTNVRLHREILAACREQGL
jgi:serine/threonine protein kinase/tetratricopeptide (TPR) repeat protein